MKPRNFLLFCCLFSFSLFAAQLYFTMEGQDSILSANAIFHGGTFVDGAPELARVLGGNRALALGGLKDGIEVPDFTLPNTGSMQFFCMRTASLIPDQGMTFLYSSGTPPYHNCIGFGASVKANGEGEIACSFINAKGVPNPVTRLAAPVSLETNEWYHVVLIWENINSGNPDGMAKLYWDGKIIAEFSGKRLDIPSPAKQIFIGSVEHSCQSNHCGTGAFCMDEVIISDRIPDEKTILEQARKLNKRTSLADGKTLPGMPVLAGGDGQYKTYSFPDFPIKAGGVYCKVKLARILPGKGLLLFDSCGTPPWHDRIAMMLKMHEDNCVELYPVIAGTPNGGYISRVLPKKVKWVPEKEHTIVFQWKNVNSDMPNMEMTLWFDGVNVATIGTMESFISNPGKTFKVGGGEKPAAAPVEKDILTILDCRVWPGDLPADLRNDLCAQTVNPSQVSTPQMTIAAASRAPVLDGKLEESYWDTCSTLGVLHKFRQNFLANTDTMVKATYFKDKLYLGWKAHFTEASPLGNFRDLRDYSVWNDDSIEFIFKTPAGTFHYIISAYGSIYDERDGDAKWNGSIDFCTDINKNFWTGEAVIPMSELQLSEGDTLEATICRNITPLQNDSSGWSSEGFSQLGAWNFKEAQLKLTGIEFPVRPTIGTNKAHLQLANLLEQNCDASIILTTGQSEDQETTRIHREILAKTSMDVDFAYNIRSTGIQPYSLSVLDGKGNVIFAQKGFLMVLPPLYVTYNSRFYENKLTLDIDATKLENAESAAGTAQIVIDGKNAGPQKKFVLDKGCVQVELDTSCLTDAGTYCAIVRITDSTGKETTQNCEFEFAPRPADISPDAGRKTYFSDGWFTPTYDNGTVKCWNRTYSWKKSIFPVSIFSNDKEMLAETPYFEYRINGQLRKLEKASVTYQGKDTEKVCFQVEASDEHLRVKASVRVEYDGFIGYDLDIAPAGKISIDHLSMVIPMKPESAQYKLEGLETTFSQKRDYIPGYPEKGKDFPFNHIGGIGCGERGLFFFIESDEGWKPYNRKNVESILPGQKKVEWRWNIVDGVPMGKIPTMHCGFQVTPYKRLRNNYLTDHRQVTIWPGGVFRPGDVPYRLENIEKFKAMGANVLQLHQNWCKHTGGTEPDDAELLKKYVQAAHAAGMKVILYKASITNPHEPTFVHFGELWLGRPIGAWNGYSVEPVTKRYSVGRCVASPEYIDWYVGHCKKLMEEYGIDGFYYDFDVGGCNNALHGCGYDGENTSVLQGQSTGTIGINVEKLEEKDKRRRVTCPVRAQRELWKRMYNMVHELRGEEGIIDAHTSNPARVFSYPFVDTMYHSESAACHGQIQMDTLDGYRLYYAKESLGTHGSLIVYGDTMSEKNLRSILALSLLHRQIFRTISNKWQLPNQDNQTRLLSHFWALFRKYDVGNAEWHPYYDNKNLLKILNGTAMTAASLWLHKDHALMVVGNLTDSDRTLEIKLSGALTAFKKVNDAEKDTGKLISLAGDVLTVQVSKNDYVILELN